MNQAFEASLSYAAPTDPVWKRAVIRLIEWCSGRPALEKKYQHLRSQNPFVPQDFWRNALEQLGITLDFDPTCFEKIPCEGPLVVIANHPFGILDGLGICHLASRMRPNFQILTNSVLCQDPELAPYLLPVNFDDTREAMRENIATKNRALATMQAGGAVVIFPGGGISTAEGWRGTVTDLEWKRFAAKLVQLSKATVIPLYFHGHNSRLFQYASQFSPTLRLALLLHEVRRQIGSTLNITIGAPLPYAALSHIKDRQALLDYLRETVYGLAPITDFNGRI